VQWRARKRRIKSKFIKDFNERHQALAQIEREMLAIMERDPEDPRAYVSLGTLYVQARRIAEAREVFGEACALEEGRNSFVWTAMANLEDKVCSVAPRERSSILVVMQQMQRLHRMPTPCGASAVASHVLRA
jgi:uncharacterized protein HemY